MTSLDEVKPTEAIHMENLSMNGEEVKHDPAADRGAAILEAERHLGLWPTIKQHKRALLFCK
jgi:hypothetical protein